jgi:hypothetical protein
MSDNQFVINPKTKRLILKSSRLYDKLVKEGVIEEVIEPTPVVTEEIIETPNNNSKKLKKKLKRISFDSIKENKDRLKDSEDLSDKQLDKLLKRMLFEKLCVKTKKAPKKKPKKKKKIVIVSSSEDESSESETSESSDD